MNNVDKQYIDLLYHILAHGKVRKDRTGVGTSAVFGHMMRFNLQEGFPALTTKHVFIRGAFEELMWFLRGETNINTLDPCVRKWWEPWADENGDLGPIYGEQWRHANWYNQETGELYQVDQLKGVLGYLKSDPNSRRIIVNLWNTVAMNHARLPCCHGSIIQFFVYDGVLHCETYQRSCDVFIGLPVNIVSYALLTHMLAAVSGLEVGDLIYVTGDTHLYHNHRGPATQQLSREFRPLPRLVIKDAPEDILQFNWNQHFSIEDYQPWPSIDAVLNI